MPHHLALLVFGIASSLGLALAEESPLQYTTKIPFSTTDFVKFGYNGRNGPDKWAELSSAYHTCADGKSQSPINIAKGSLFPNKKLLPLTRDYAVESNATLINKGFNIGLQFHKDIGTLSVDGKKYALVNLHWHTPAEHTINGARYAAELHLVHRSQDERHAVVGILFQYGDPDPFLLQLKDKLKELAKKIYSEKEESHIEAGVVDLKPLRRGTRKYYRYMGSLSTPPCTEDVIWNVLGKARHISKEQVAALRAPLRTEFRNNSRPLQLLNGRKVELYSKLKEAKAPVPHKSFPLL